MGRVERSRWRGIGLGIASATAMAMAVLLGTFFRGHLVFGEEGVIPATGSASLVNAKEGERITGHSPGSAPGVAEGSGVAASRGDATRDMSSTSGRWAALQENVLQWIDANFGTRWAWRSKSIYGSDSPAANSELSPDTSNETNSGNRSKRNAEILMEVFKITLDRSFGREAKDRAEFGSWLDTMNQGASLEGIYNGFTHSADFRLLEERFPGASAESLQLFADELVRIEVELPQITDFGSDAAKPLPRAIEPSAGAGLARGPLDPVKPRAQNVETSVLARKYVGLFVGASLFTLKRILGDEAQKLVLAKRREPDVLADWYAQWSVRMAMLAQVRGVEFGVALRHSTDRSFHYRWALKAIEQDPDRLLWEVLNRYHRVLNHANRLKQ